MGLRQRPTIYDVAEQAGVSISTVSLALNKPARVAETTRSRIFDAMASLDYHPKTEASLLARRGLGRIAVVAPFSAHASFYRRLNGIMSASEGEGVDIVVYDHPSLDTKTSPLLTSVPIRGSVDGLIAMGMPVDEEQFQSVANVPIVVVDFEHRLFDSITVGDTQGGRLAGEHLLLKPGCVDFAFIGEPQASMAYSSPRSQRLRGFQLALAEAGQSLDDANIATVSPLSGSEAVDSIAVMLERLSPPSAVLAYSDRLAALVIRTARRLGLSIPDELRVVGFDDSDLAEALELTSVRVPFFDSGRHAFEMMARRLTDPDLPVHAVRLGQQLVVRESTMTPAGSTVRPTGRSPAAQRG